MKITIEEEIPTAWGKPGEPGDNLKIKKAIDKLIDACNHLYDVEVDILFTKPHQCFYKLKETLQGITFNIFEELKRIHEDIHKIFCQSNPVGEYKIIIKFDLPSNINDFMKEVERLKNNPQEWINIFLKKF